jgi:transcriptional regulator with XRE-family HTH domain
MTEPLHAPADDQIGKRIRDARLNAAMTQSQLGDFLGCSSQQIHKYERGSNRVSAGTLFMIARILEYPVEWFFLDAERDFGGIGETSLFLN